LVSKARNVHLLLFEHYVPLEVPMKSLLIAAAMALVAATPLYADSWTPASLPDAAPVALVAFGFLAIASAMKGRKL
jgi:hypothetical protein